MKFKCRLRVILAEKEIKHGDFAKAIGVSTGGLSAIVNNKSLPTFTVVYRICEELEMGINDVWVKIEN